MKTIYKSILTISLAAILTGCDYTDLDPTDKVSGKDIFSSTSALEQGVNGAYSLFRFDEIIRSASILSDDVQKGGQNGGASDDTYQWSYTAPTGDHNNLWEKGYQVIAMTNRILEGADDVPADTDAEIASRNNSIANAKFLRAYMSFNLLRFFADFENGTGYGIPYVTEVITLQTPGRNTVTECFTLTLKDLEEAYGLVAQNTPEDPAYVSKTAINALRARVALYQRDYTKAYEYASGVFQQIPLASREKYPDIWIDKSNEEVIMKLPRLSGNETIGTIYFSANNSSAFEPSPEIIAIYDEEDIRLHTFIGDGIDREGVPVKRVIKYQGTEVVGLADAKLFRASEMLLIMAEAKIQTNDFDEANRLLNQLRANRIEGWTETTYTTKDALIEQLLLERRRELCYEGHRYMDLRRYDLPVVKPAINKTLEVGNYRRIYPIPYGETQGNPVIAAQQNPGY